MNPSIYIESLHQDELTIFLFHGVIQRSTTRVRNYTRKHILADEFRSVLKALLSHGTPLSMNEVIYCTQAKQPFPTNAFAVTFDDGFENNFSVAAPILHELGVPATFYVTTDFITYNHLSWIDKIEFCFEAVDIPFATLPWHDRNLTLRTVRDKIKLLDEIRWTVKCTPGIDLDYLVQRLFDLNGMQIPVSSDDPLDLKMNWRQVHDLHSDALFLVGGHSCSHEILSFLDGPRLEREIADSLAALSREGGLDTQHYSYPEGQENSYNQDVIICLKEHGIVCCPTAIEGTNPLGTDLFHLKRLSVS